MEHTSYLIQLHRRVALTGAQKRAGVTLKPDGRNWYLNVPRGAEALVDRLVAEHGWVRGRDTKPCLWIGLLGEEDSVRYLAPVEFTKTWFETATPVSDARAWFDAGMPD